MPECLICLDRVSRTWTPQTPCACQPILHKKCWNEWIKQKEICVICRVHFGPDEARPERSGPDEASGPERSEASGPLGYRPDHLTLEEQIHMGMLALLISLLISLIVVTTVSFILHIDFGEEEL